MKILLLCDSLIKGGRERRMIELVKGLLQMGDVKLEMAIFSNVIDYPEIHDMDITLHIVERIPKRSPKVFLDLYKICKDFKPDIIHSWSSMTSIFAFPSIKLLGIKLINGNIANAPKNLKIWKKELFRAKLTFPFSNVIIGNSNAGLEAYKAPKERSQCIYNGFDFNRVKSIESIKSVRERYGIKTKYAVCKIAAFTNRKDYRTFLSAAKLILEQRDDISFLAVGKGPNLENAKESVPADYKNHIIFTGAVLDVESLINAVNVGVLCTNIEVHGEGISNSIMEYMVMKKPVVATAGGGTNELIIDGETGYLMPPNAPEILAEKVHNLIDDQKLATKLGSAGRQRIEAHFNLDKMTMKYYQLYKQLIGQ